ncbi:hypothetical protein MKSMC1_29390 [Mycobacterium kansasii]|nr:hypothetical protein MKSMC1_29390 [Mycobacterium kansasii]
MAGVGYQHAQAVLAVLRLADEPALARVRVEGQADAIDVEVWCRTGELAAAFQYKRRNQQYTWGRQELIDQLAAWSQVGVRHRIAEYQFVTDGRLGPTGRAIRDALDQAASGDRAALIQVLQDAVVGADMDAVCRARIVIDAADFASLTERAKQRARSLLTNVSSAAEADERSRAVVFELLHMVTERSGKPDDSERFIDADELVQLLARPQDHLPTARWGDAMKDAFLASVLASQDYHTLDLACVADAVTADDRQERLLEEWIAPSAVTIVSGGAGIGKSTALARMQHRLAQRGVVALIADAESYLPGRLGALLGGALNRHADLGAHAAVGTAAAKDPRIIMAIDSISEISPPSRDALREELRQLLTADHRASVVLAGRDAAVSRRLTCRVADSAIVRIAPLTQEQQITLISDGSPRLGVSALLTVEAARRDQARCLAQQVRNTLGNEVAANPLMLLLGVRALLTGGEVINPAAAFRAVVRSIAADNGYSDTSVYEAGLGATYGQLIDGGTRYIDSLGWTSLLEQAAAKLCAAGHELSAAELREFGFETGLTHVAEYDVVRPLHDSFADYFAASAVHAGFADLPQQLRARDSTRVRYVAGLGGVRPALAESVIRDLPLTAVAISVYDRAAPSPGLLVDALRYLDALLPADVTRQRIAIWPDRAGRYFLIVGGEAEGWLDGNQPALSSPYAWAAPLAAQSGPLAIAIRIWHRHLRDVLAAIPRQPRPVTHNFAESVAMLTGYADELQALSSRIVAAVGVQGEESALLDGIVNRRMQFRVHDGQVSSERRRAVDYRETYDTTATRVVATGDSPDDGPWTGRAAVDTFLTTTPTEWAINSVRKAINDTVGSAWLSDHT